MKFIFEFLIADVLMKIGAKCRHVRMVNIEHHQVTAHEKTTLGHHHLIVLIRIYFDEFLFSSSMPVFLLDQMHFDQDFSVFSTIYYQLFQLKTNINSIIYINLAINKNDKICHIYSMSFFFFIKYRHSAYSCSECSFIC